MLVTHVNPDLGWEARNEKRGSQGGRLTGTQPSSTGPNSSDTRAHPRGTISTSPHPLLSPLTSYPPGRVHPSVIP